MPGKPLPEATTAKPGNELERTNLSVEMVKVKATDVQQIRGGERLVSADLVAVEEPLEIRLGFGPLDRREQRVISVTMRTPGDDLELAAGFLFSEAIINRSEDILRIAHCRAGEVEGADFRNVVRVELHPEVLVDWKQLERHFYTSSSCGVCGKTAIEAVHVTCRKMTDLRFPALTPQILLRLPAQLLERQAAFQHTGGLHAAGLFDAQGRLQDLREDVGRHNALDKLIGHRLFAKGLPLDGQLILLSGRASFELVQKAARAGAPVLVAVGPPTSLAVELAQNLGITLIGFLREERFNIYSWEERICE